MKKARNNIIVEVDTPIEGTCAAMAIIRKLGEINKLDFNLSIAYDFETDGQGVYFPKMKGQSHRIFINPFNCLPLGAVDDPVNEPFWPGYTADLSVFGITIHEFSHFLTYQMFPDMLSKFKEQFSTNRLYLNNYCNNEIHDELAEFLTLYITNPYLLKLISKPHWQFCNTFFKSPMPCTKQKCAEIYSEFPIKVKDHMRLKWKLTYNIHTKSFERIKE